MKEDKKMTLELLETVDIPESVLDHRFVKKLKSILLERSEEAIYLDPVIGTKNLKKAELYGWSGSVASHTDNKGFVYILILSGGNGQLSCGDTSINMADGMILCMDDYTPHQTIQYGSTLAIFVGAFNERQDDFAVTELKSALLALSSGDYYRSPRPGSGDLDADECYCSTELSRGGHALSIGTDEELHIKLSEDALADGDYVVMCSEDGCDKPACILDRFYPYHQEHNACVFHNK